jgi:hypothetical protein
MELERFVLTRTKELFGISHVHTIRSALNLAGTLMDEKQFAEAKQILREYIPASKTALGTEHDLTLVLRASYAGAIYKDGSASRGDLREAVAVLEDVTRISHRVYGSTHPETLEFEDDLREAKEALARAADDSTPADT